MALGPFVEDIVLNPTALPNDPNSIKVSNTILTDSRIKRCIIDATINVDDGGDTTTTVGDIIQAIADANTDIGVLETSFNQHAQDAASRHINPVAGTDNYYLAYDSAGANGTTNVWKPLPTVAASAPLIETLQKTVINVPGRNAEYTLSTGKHLVFNMGFIPAATDVGGVMCRLLTSAVEDADIGTYTYFTLENLPPNCQFVIDQEDFATYTGTGIGSGLDIRVFFDDAGNVSRLFKTSSGVIGLRLVNISLDSPGTTGRSDARVLWFEVVDGDVSTYRNWIENDGVSVFPTGYPMRTDGILTLIYPNAADGNYAEQQSYISFPSFMHLLNGGTTVPNYGVYMSDGSGAFAFKEVYSSENPPPATSAEVFELKTTSFTAAANHFYQVNVGAPITITFPANPARGDAPITFRITGASTTSAVTFARNGKNIEGIADDGYITGNGTIKVKYAGDVGSVSVGWYLAEGQTQ